MPWKISERNGTFCVVTKDDGEVVKCHSTREKAKSHLTALYVNEPSAAKKSMGYGLLKSAIEERVVEIKACGANKPGGGGFSAGNTCARGGGSSGTSETRYQTDLQGIRRRVAKGEQDGITVLFGLGSGKHNKYIATDGKREEMGETPQKAVDKLKKRSKL